MQPSTPPTASRLITQTGGRGTAARVATLQCLLSARHALSHQEIDQTLAQDGLTLDRVTLYRTLDWLIDKQLAHKITTDDRTWRFSASAEHIAEHAHFHCTECDQVFCMNEVNPSFIIALPPGFTLKHAELNMAGICDQCQPPQPRVNK